MAIDAQSVTAPLSRSAVFLTLTVQPGEAAATAVRGLLGGLDDLVKTVGFRDLPAHLSCVVGIGSEFWDRIDLGKRPRELHPFTPVHGTYQAPSTPGDLLFHIRAERSDLCFELERLILSKVRNATRVEDEVVGFRYFDARDLLGFVDGTANPTNSDLPKAALVGPEDPDFLGGSYIVVQKYLHDLDHWDAIPTEEQERIIGRSKFDNVEFDSATERRPSHKSLATIEDGEGGELSILRDNMPFGRPGEGEYGTFFIGYCGRLSTIEAMLRRMFIGEPPGSYDRILDVSRAVTGAVFFAPTLAALSSLG